jgi:GcrA cell cycle regulator
MTKTDIITMAQGVAEKACTLELAPEAAGIIAPEPPLAPEPETAPDPVSESTPESDATVSGESVPGPTLETPVPAKNKGLRKRVNKPAKNVITSEPVPEQAAEPVISPAHSGQEHGEATGSAVTEAPTSPEAIGPEQGPEEPAKESLGEEPSPGKPVRVPAKPTRRASGVSGSASNSFGPTGFKPVKKSVTLPVYPASKVDLSIPIDQRKKIDELTSETCRWPVGTPGSKGFFFCGGQTLDGDVYCKAHAKRAYSGQYRPPIR